MGRGGRLGDGPHLFHVSYTLQSTETVAMATKKAQWVHRGVHWSRKNMYEHTHRYNEWNKGESGNTCYNDIDMYQSTI